jgi:hypothetical protein
MRDPDPTIGQRGGCGMSDYHGRIMNIPTTEWGASYKHGHRDARHAAAEIALEAAAEVRSLRAAGEEALHQLVILNGLWATESPGGMNGWRIDTSEAIASLKAALPAPPVDAPAQPSHP